MEEIWKPYIYTYEISNLGNLRNSKTGHLLKTHLTNGYLSVVVSLGSRKKFICIKIHRAVAETFLPNPNNLPQVNHIDGDKTNNCVDNLEWCNNQYNTQHAWNNGLCTPKFGENNTNAKLTREDVDFIRAHYKPYDKEFGIRALSRKYKVHHETIRHALYGENWK